MAQRAIHTFFQAPPEAVRRCRSLFRLSFLFLFALAFLAIAEESRAASLGRNLRESFETLRDSSEQKEESRPGAADARPASAVSEFQAEPRHSVQATPDIADTSLKSPITERETGQVQLNPMTSEPEAVPSQDNHTEHTGDQSDLAHDALLVADAKVSLPPEQVEKEASAQKADAPVTGNIPSAKSYIDRKPIRLFGTVEFRSPIKNLPKWDRVRISERRKPSFKASGLDSSNKGVATRWSKLKENLKDATLDEKIKGVNAFFNQWPYKTDSEVWGVEDYWATPREFVVRSGDCEDYAIAKYYALRDLGVPKEILRIAAVKDQIRNLGHAILIVYMDDEAYVLDNLTNLVLSHKRLSHYALVYTVNEDFLWRHIKPKPKPANK